MTQACDKALINGVADLRHNDWDCLMRLLGESDRRCARRHDDIDLQAHKLLGQPRQPINSSFSGSVFDANVPSFAQGRDRLTPLGDPVETCCPRR
jgi:hypothetical protein